MNSQEGFGQFQISGYSTGTQPSSSGRRSSANRTSIPQETHNNNNFNSAHGRSEVTNNQEGDVRDGGDRWEDESLTDSIQGMLLNGGADQYFQHEDDDFSAGEELPYYGEEDDMSLDEDFYEEEDDADEDEEDEGEVYGEDEDDIMDDEGGILDEFSDEDEAGPSGGAQRTAGRIFGEKMDSFHQGLIPDPSKIKPTGAKESRTGTDKLGRKYTKRRKAADMPLSHEVQSLLGQANQAYVNHQHEQAQRLVTQVIQIDATVYPAWRVLGEIYREKGDNYRCLLAWITAAHVRPNDNEQWTICARMSLELSESEQYQNEASHLREQAIYLFTQAIKQDPNDMASIFQRANLHKDCRKFKDAARGFETLLAKSKTMPHDMTIVKDLAQCYVDIGNINQAIELFETHIEYWKSNPNPGEEGGGFGWTHINIFGDILLLAQKWEKGIREIRSLARWLYGRRDETFWDDLDDDREWDRNDPRRNQVEALKQGRQRPRPSSSYELPPDLRLKLAIFRLKLNHVEEANNHLELLKYTDPLVYPEAVLGAGDACAEACKHHDALEFYGSLQDNDEFDNAALWMRFGTSLQAVGNLEQAEEFFKHIAEDDPTDIASRNALIDLYKEQGDRDLIPSLRDEIKEIRRIQEEKAALEEQKRIEAETSKASSGNGMFNAFLRSAAPSRSKRPSRRAAPSASSGAARERAPSTKKDKREAASKRRRTFISQRYLQEKHKTEMCIRNYRKLEELASAVKADDPMAIEEWMEAAEEMIKDFMRSTALYPSERYMKYVGFLGYSVARNFGRGDNRKLENEGVPDKTVYRGVNLDTWLDIILEYSIQLTLQGDYEEATKLLRRAADANVYFHDKRGSDQNQRPLFLIHITHLACSIVSNDPRLVQTAFRWFTSNRMFENDSYSLFTTVSCMVRGALDGGDPLFNHSINQKYFMRHFRLVDQHVLKMARSIPAAPKDEDGKALLPTSNSVALSLLYGNMLSSGTSYAPAMNYYARAYHELPNHPMVLFTLGLAYLHRAFQSQAENRQYQILQGLQFVFKYYENRIEAAQKKDKSHMFFDLQEAEFNIARAFHQIGLPHHAIPFYEKVLKISEDLPQTDDEYELKIRQISNLKWEAAYNLQLIYAASGNVEFAKAITDKYLVI